MMSLQDALEFPILKFYARGVAFYLVHYCYYDLSGVVSIACMEGHISKSGMKDLDRPDRGSLEVRCM